MLGGGAWGTALAIAMRRAGMMSGCGRATPRPSRRSASRGENTRYLPGIPIDPAILATSDAAEALEGADYVLAAVPAQQLRQALAAVAGLVPADATIILCAKGIEQTTGKLLSAIVEEVLPGRPVAALSGPSFAADVGQGPADGGGDRRAREGSGRRACRDGCRPSSSAAIRPTISSASRSAAR